MQIPGWAYIVVGVFVSGISGYVYTFIPKPNGDKNISMALFFFIGMIFIIIGIIKFFFIKIDSEQENIIKKQQIHLKNTELHNISKVNRVEQQISKAYEQQSTPKHHTSQYAQTHAYNDLKNVNLPTNNTAHNQAPTHAIHNQTQAHVNQPISKTLNNIISCPKCGTKNYTHSNFCHVCGNRLK